MKRDESTILLFRTVPSQSYDTIVIDNEQEETVEESEAEKKKVIICAFCGNTITDMDQIISVNGSHHHIFANPHGIVFDIRCFKQCDGCTVDPQIYSEFSWFHGYNWQVAGCSRCYKHLGWQFRSNYAKPSKSDSYDKGSHDSFIPPKARSEVLPLSSFYCLILEHIVIPK